MNLLLVSPKGLVTMNIVFITYKFMIFLLVLFLSIILNKTLVF